MKINIDTLTELRRNRKNRPLIKKMVVENKQRYWKRKGQNKHTFKYWYEAVQILEGDKNGMERSIP